MRRDRFPTITVHADPRTGLPSQLFNRVREKIEQIKLPPGYTLEWGGEYEDSRKARAALAKPLPACLALMVFIVVCLFNSIRIHAVDLADGAVGDYRRDGRTADHRPAIRLHGSAWRDRFGGRADQELDRR